MRRMLLVLTVGAMMAALLAVAVTPAMALDIDSDDGIDIGNDGFDIEDVDDAGFLSLLDISDFGDDDGDDDFGDDDFDLDDDDGDDDSRQFFVSEASEFDSLDIRN